MNTATRQEPTYACTFADIVRFMLGAALIGFTIGICFDVVVAKVVETIPAPVPLVGQR